MVTVNGDHKHASVDMSHCTFTVPHLLCQNVSVKSPVIIWVEVTEGQTEQHND